MHKLTPISQDEFDIRALASIASELDHLTPAEVIYDDSCFPGPADSEPYWPPYQGRWFESIREEAAPVIDDEGEIRCILGGQRRIQQFFLIPKTISFRYHQYQVLLTKYSLAIRRVIYGEAYAEKNFKPPVYAAYAAALDQENRARPLTAEENTALWDTLREERVTYQVLYEDNETTQERHVTLLQPEAGPRGKWAKRLHHLSALSAHKEQFKNTKLLRIKLDAENEEFPDSLDRLAAEIALDRSISASVREMSLPFADVRRMIERRSRTIVSRDEAMELLQPFITKDGEIAISAATVQYARDLMNMFSAVRMNAFGVTNLVVIDAQYSRFEALNTISEHRTYLCREDGGRFYSLGTAERERVLSEIEEYIWSVDQIYQLYEELENLL